VRRCVVRRCEVVRPGARAVRWDRWEGGGGRGGSRFLAHRLSTGWGEGGGRPKGGAGGRTCRSTPHSSTQQVDMKAMCGADAALTNLELARKARYVPCGWRFAARYW
jgi:hypothetical protein